MPTFRDLVTAVVCCYITREFHYAKRDSGLSAFRGVMLQRCVWEKTLIDISAEILIFLQKKKKFLTSVPCCLFYCRLAF